MGLLSYLTKTGSFWHIPHNITPFFSYSISFERLA